MVFGIHCPEFDNSFLQDFISSMDMAVNLIKPGGLPPVELIPALKYIPERWAPWKQLCKEARGLQRRLCFGLLDVTINRIKDGRRTDCFMEYLLDHQEQYGLDYEISACVLYIHVNNFELNISISDISAGPCCKLDHSLQLPICGSSLHVSLRLLMSWDEHRRRLII